MTNHEAFPPLPLDQWKETKATLHLFSQTVGKLRLALTPKVNHWWNAPLYVSARGLTTHPIPNGRYGVFEMELDFLDHDLVIRTSAGANALVSLREQSVSSFQQAVFDVLGEQGVHAAILAKPFDSERIQSTGPFPAATYDEELAHRFWRVLVGVDTLFKEFRARFEGKCSPVHFFWHSFDLSVTRFSGRRAPLNGGADVATREAHSYEAVSAGFWPGDQNMPEPAFYTYVFPEPDGLADQPLGPEFAWWDKQMGSSMALLRYEDFRKSKDPRETLLEFLQTAYEAGADLANWPRKDLEPMVVQR